jgi:Cof subfamily protein (haloacid dehalogenase superfamily)
MQTLPFRLAAIDLDETLLGPDKGISAENRKAIERLLEAGIQIVLASGRRYENMIRYATELGLSGPIITCQGAVAMEIGSREILYESCLKTDHAARVIEEGLSRSLTLLRYHDDATYANRRDRITDLYDARSGDSTVVVRPFEELSGRIMKVIWLAEPPDVPGYAAWAAANLPEVHSVATDPEYLELMDWGANKAAALEAVAAKAGIAQAEVLAFGDGNNDAGMLEWAGFGIAMAHGSEAAHAASDQVAPDGDPETALARSIDRLFLE